MKKAAIIIPHRILYLEAALAIIYKNNQAESLTIGIKS